MPDIRADEIGTQKHHRTFIQYGGPRPGNPVRYAGQDAQYVIIQGTENPETGGFDPVWVPDPNRIGRYRLVGRSVSTPDMPSSTLVFHEKHGTIPRSLIQHGRLNAYEVVGKCKDLSDFLRGWTSYVQIYEDGEVSDKDLGDRQSWDSDDGIENSLTVTWASVYPIGALAFGEQASTQVDREVKGVTYASGDACIDPNDFGDKRIYAVISPSGAGSPGLPAEVVYSLDGGAVWYQTDIDGIGATEAVFGIAVVGSYLLVIGTAAYYFCEVNTKTGVPGTWTKVTTGFVAAHNPNDVLVLSPREIFFAGDGGYIYKSTDITAGVTVINAGVATTQNLLRIAGSGETLLATGVGGAIAKSANRGETWALTTTTPETGWIQAVEVINDEVYWVGTSNGFVYSTENGGETWTPKTMPGATAGGAVRDIKFPTQSVGYVLWNSSSPAGRLYTTWNGGADWTYQQSRILNFPTIDWGGRLAYPKTDYPGYNCNALAIGGLAGNGVDGVILIGYAGRQ